jgi:protein-S-isoprenylcysteine O-methyltransferase Ste14
MAAPVVALGLVRYRADYRRHGRTTAPGVVALLAAWFMPMGVLGFAIPFFPTPTRPIHYLGYVLMLTGLALLLLPLLRFSPSMVVGRKVEGLITGGVYGYSRNPQYAAWFLFVFGYAMTGRSVMAYVGVALYMVVAHLTALVEEEHLERAYGAEYRRYRASTPRYFRWFRRGRTVRLKP